MDAPKTPHPDDQILHEYGLGKLDDELTSTIDEHLNACHECRERVASATADSFLGRFRDIPKPTAESIPTDSLGDSTLSWIQPKPGSPPRSTNPMPPGLAEHPDYQIKRELGQGGMGVVYLAHNVLMGRDEVLKVLSRRIMERPSVLERFQREIRTVAKLSHPNIVAAYSAFRIEGGLVFAMEYVEGLDLSKLITTKGPLSVAHAADFVRQAALGLQHAHEMGMVHRDIKPANLILTRVGESKVVKVLDFGLAKAHHEQNVEGPLTLKGQALGTPAYIAPEQIMDAPDVDIRADLYSLGATLFHLLAGHPPFECGSIYDLYQAHISRDADSLTLLRPEVPAELSALVAKMMAKAPKQRFQTPAEVAQALTPFCKSKAAKVQAETSQFDPTRSDPFVTVQEPESPEPASTVPDRVFTDQTREEFIDRAVRETPKPHQSTPEPNRPHNKERLIRGVEAAEFGPIESQLRRLGLVGGLAIIAIIGVVLLGLYVTVIANRGDIRREDNGSKVASVSAPSLSEPTADGKREEIRPTATPEPSPLRTVPNAAGVEPVKSSPTLKPMENTSLPTTRLVHVDEFNNPRKGFLKDLNTLHDPNHGQSDGVYYVYRSPGGLNAFNMHEIRSHDSCEVVARVVSQDSRKAAAWAVLVSNKLVPRGFFIKINVKGELSLEPSPWENAKAFRQIDPRRGPIVHPAIKPGSEYNKLLLILRDREVVILVNDVQVCDPVKFDYDLTPSALQFGVAGPGKNRAEFDRLEIRTMIKPEDAPKH